MLRTVADEPPLRAVLFDLDGTLVDSAPDLRACVNLLLAEAGRPRLPLEQVVGMIGDGVAMLIRRAFAATGEPLPQEAVPDHVARFVAHYQGPDAPHLSQIYPGALDAIDRLRAAGLKIAVCTNKMQVPAEAVLSQFDLARRVDVLIGGDRAPKQKPDPAHLEAALVALEVTPEEAVMVGDGINDVTSGKAARLATVAVSWGYRSVPVEALGADRIIDRYEDLPPILGVDAALAASTR